MLPLRDSIPSRHFPVMSVLLIVVNLYIFYYESQLGAGIEELIYRLGLVPSHYSNYQVSNYYPFLTSMFLHGSWMHVIGNMWILWLFGDNVEDRMGRVRFILFYLICGLAAGLTHLAVNPTSTLPVVGASGAVAGVMGAYFLMFHHAKVLTLIPPFFLINIPAWIYLGFWVISQLWCGAIGLFAASSCGQIAFWAHIGGFITGMLGYRFFLRSGYKLSH
ncbi:MAG: rhomboid family intramembrane serine protease [Syntrophomonadaceae bacterium]|jgi:membrane associated rhomboid family serine protease